MGFKNEYIPKADYEKYDLLKICREHNKTLGRDRFVHPSTWTIDHLKDVFCIQIWSNREAEFEGYAFYWKGEWIFFDMRPVDSKYDQTRNAIWFHLLVKDFAVPSRLIARREELVDDLRAAITAKDAVTCTISHRSATIEFITE